MLCIRKYVNLLFEREGVHALSKTDMLRIYATYISSLIMGGEVSPKIGAGIISSVSRSHVVPGFHDLDPFNYASSEMEDRPEDKKFFEEAILAEAAVWTTRNYADILK